MRRATIAVQWQNVVFEDRFQNNKTLPFYDGDFTSAFT